MFKPFTIEEKEHIENEYERLFKTNNISEELKEKYKMLLQNVYNYYKYVYFEENCKIINTINRLEEVESHVKAIVLKSDMNNIKEGMVLDIYDLNELYIKDYEENKDKREVEVSHNGTRTIVNPFRNVSILLVIEKENHITFVDKFDFCSKTELKQDFYDALEYHYIPAVFRSIIKTIYLDSNQYKENKNFKFSLCNGHKFEDFKNKNIEDLDYEKTHDLAVIENREMFISAYLGVYNNAFELTYSVHSKSDYDSNLENVEAELIDMSKINNEKELKDIMIEMTKEYFNGKDKLIETLSNRLNENSSYEFELNEEESEAL